MRYINKFLLLSNTLSNFKISILLCLFFCIINIYIVYSQSDEAQLSSQIKENNKRIEDIQKEIDEYSKKILEKKGDATTLKRALDLLKDTKSKLSKDIELSEYKIKNTNYEIKETEDKISDTTEKIDKLKANLISSLKEIERQKKENSNYIILFLDNRSISQIMNSYQNKQNFKNNINQNITKFSILSSVLKENKNTYQDKVKTLELSKVELNEKKKLVLQNENDKSRVLKETKNEESNFQKILAERKKQKLELEKEILDFESKIKALVDTNRLPKAGNGVLAYPLKNVNITQYFGNTPFSTKNPQVYNGAGHNGVDFAVPVGANIYSSGDGIVLGVGDTDLSCRGASYGRWIMIRHDNGLTTLYAHLSSFAVSEGVRVSSGDKIALSGNTGYSTGPHLHFAVFASDGVRVSGDTEYKSKTCGTYLKLPIAPRNAYLNPLTYL